ncbi:tyrosine-type recombinase/integrase [Chloroflexota bacterium]
MKKQFSLEQLRQKYDLACRADGKSPKTVEGYNQIICALIRYMIEAGLRALLSDFSIDAVRAYILFLAERPKFQGHPFTPPRGKGLAKESIRDHVRTLKAFSTWSFNEGYIQKNVLKTLKLPKPDQLIIVPLTFEEKTHIFKAINQNTYAGRRARAFIEVLLDTGVRVSGIIGANVQDLNVKEGCLKIMGKGRKERFVPIGIQTLATLVDYITHDRPKYAKPDCTALFITVKGEPLSENAVKLMFTRLAKKSGIRRLHAHLCRHTFAIDYLMNGGDIYSLKEILGHSSLTMVERYLHFTQAQITTRHRQFSPMDKFKEQNRPLGSNSES